jgi:hypothetical protein
VVTNLNILINNIVDANLSSNQPHQPFIHIYNRFTTNEKPLWPPHLNSQLFSSLCITTHFLCALFICSIILASHCIFFSILLLHLVEHFIFEVSCISLTSFWNLFCYIFLHLFFIYIIWAFCRFSQNPNGFVWKLHFVECFCDFHLNYTRNTGWCSCWDVNNVIIEWCNFECISRFNFNVVDVYFLT